MSEIINFKDFKQGKYRKKERMTLEECIKELDDMFPNETPRQQTALGVRINLMIQYITGGDDGK